MSRTRGYAMDTGWALILEDAGISVPDLLEYLEEQIDG